MIRFLTNLFALWTILGTAWAWFVPEHFLWVVDGRFRPFGQSLVSVMLGLIMLGMGLALSFDDFKRIAKIPKCVGSGVALQFTVMPLAGVSLAMIFGLEAGLAVGLILVVGTHTYLYRRFVRDVFPGPRARRIGGAALALLRAVRAAAALAERDFATPDDVKALAPHVLPHRLILRPAAELAGQTPLDVVEDVLAGVPAPTE